MADLISTATNRQLTIDDVSVFDTLPLSPEGSEDKELVREAEATFSCMVEAKKPDVILCCYQGNSSNSFVNNLRSIGVGKVFRTYVFTISPDCSAQRINVFHPSYAVNYKPHIVASAAFFFLSSPVPFITRQENGKRSRGWSLYDRIVAQLAKKSLVSGIEITQPDVAFIITFIRGPEDASRKTNELTRCNDTSLEQHH